MRLFASLALAMSAVVAFNQLSEDSPVMLTHQETPMNYAGNDLRLLQGGGQGSNRAKGGRDGKKRQNGKHQTKGSKFFRGSNSNTGNKPNKQGGGGPRNPGGRQPSFPELQGEAASP
ncbi:hypothetical protein AeMF1_016641 [Aphanomyces euteiches]|nr:hypothetical protein AeMF1_016641 [Aphanomyces euteiches]KAH9131088.1 hypothetical protein AeNC1_019767 [Aphanomyces euteiches]